MYFVTFHAKEKEHLGVLSLKDQTVIPLQEAEAYYLETNRLPDTMQELIEQSDFSIEIVQNILSRADEQCPKLPLHEVRILAPIPRPRKNIFCIGKNYIEHALEFEKTGDVQSAVPKVPVVFSKPPTCVIGPDDIVKHHRPFVTQIDYEVELAVIIGQKATRVKKEQAYDVVFGYTILNDVTSRDLQKNHAQWLMGKGPDTYAPMGPSIVHKSKISDPHQLFIQSKINGELRQNSNTKEMVFDIPTLIETISSVITLEPGDIIATGTPAGVGAGFTPPKFLQPGDEMVLEIEKIGVLRNTVEK